MFHKFLRQIPCGNHMAINWIPQDMFWRNDNVGSGNGLVPPCTKPLHEPMLTKFYDPIWRHRGQWVLHLHLNIICTADDVKSNGLASNKRQLIVGTDRDRVYLRHMLSLGHKELTLVNTFHSLKCKRFNVNSSILYQLSLALCSFWFKSMISRIWF